MNLFFYYFVFSNVFLYICTQKYYNYANFKRIKSIGIQRVECGSG